MKRVTYTKYVPDPASEMSMEDLLGALSDYLLQSGFQNQYANFYEMPNDEQTDQQLREQIEQMQADGKLEQLLDQLIKRLEDENYISVQDPTPDPSRQSSLG